MIEKKFTMKLLILQLMQPVILKNYKNYIRTFKLMKIRKIIDKRIHEIEFLKIAQLEKN